MHVIELQLKEDIAAVPTTVYKGSKTSVSNGQLVSMALSEGNTGLESDPGLVS